MSEATVVAPENITDAPYFCLFAPGGTWQPSTLADDYATCLAFMQMLYKAKLSKHPSELFAAGFAILPVDITMTVTGDEEAAFQAGKAAIG